MEATRTTDEVFAIVREAAGDDDRFMEGMAALARRDAIEALQRLRDEPLDPERYDATGWAELHVLGRKLTAAAGLVAHHEHEKTPA